MKKLIFGIQKIKMTFLNYIMSIIFILRFKINYQILINFFIKNW